METFKIQVLETNSKEVEIQLPYFATDGICHVYKVYSNNNCIQVTNTDFNPSIIVAHAGLAFNSSNSKQCTEEEFLDAYNEVKNKLEDLALKN